jgi:hypothetical protein
VGANKPIAFQSPLLLLLFPYLVLFLILWRWFSIIICIINFFGEFYAELALLNPRCFRLQNNPRLFKFENFQDHVCFDARDHVWRLNKRKAERWFQVNISEGPFAAFQWNFDVLIKVAESLLLRKHIQKHILLILQEIFGVLLVVFISSF